MARFGLKEVCNVTLIDLITNEPALYMDTLKMSDIEMKATDVYAQGGRGNPRIASWTYDRQGTVKIQDALMSMEALAVLAGSSTTTGTVNVFGREVLTVAAATSPATGNGVKLQNTPISGTVSVYPTTDGGKSLGTALPSADLTITAKEVDFSATDAAIGTQVVVFYQYSSVTTAESLVITSDKFPGYYKLIGDTVVRDEMTGQDIPAQIIIPQAKLSSTFTLTMRPDGNPSVLDFTLEVFKMTGQDEMLQINKLG